MEWKDMPKGRRPILLKETDYISLSDHFAPGEVLEDFKPSDEAYSTLSRHKRPEEGAFLRRSGELLLGTQASPACLAHEIGHMRGSSTTSIIQDELNAWYLAIKGSIKAGNYGVDIRSESINSIAAYIKPKAYYGLEEGWTNSRILAGRLVDGLERRAKSELKREGYKV